MEIVKPGVENAVNLQAWLIGKLLKCKEGCGCEFKPTLEDIPNISVAKDHRGSYSGPEPIHYSFYVFSVACPHCGITGNHNFGKDFVLGKRQAA